MTQTIEQMVAALVASTGVTDPAVQALIVTVATDSTNLAIRSASGEDVAAELLQVKAQALNLEETIRERAQQHITDWLMQALTQALVIGLGTL